MGKETPNERYIRLLRNGLGTVSSRHPDVPLYRDLLERRLVIGQYRGVDNEGLHFTYEGLTLEGAQKLDELVKRRLRWRLLTGIWTAGAWLFGVVATVAAIVSSDWLKGIIGLCTPG